MYPVPATPATPQFPTGTKHHPLKISGKATYQNSREEGLSIYIHLPYCESLCTYCGCNTCITVNHAVEEPYINTLLKEWQIYHDLLEEAPLIKEIHLGGGTPTFFSPDNLKRLIGAIVESGKVGSETKMSFEAHPNNTTTERMKTLYDLGFRRISLGIQDFDPAVQEIINRVQPFEKVEEFTRQAREIGYTSVNFDLIYGLPKQSAETVADTIRKTIRLMPDRIAFYSYAHVPWMKPAQKMFEQHLPAHEAKRKLYELGKSILEDQGYYEIGMDHFALKTDSLYLASQQGKLHRNFMGYSTNATKLLVGLGASSISDTWTAFGQNIKSVEPYMQCVNEGRLPLYRGHLLTKEDMIMRQHILNIMCHSRTEWSQESAEAEVLSHAMNRLREMARDKIVKLDRDSIRVYEDEKPFIRNVCMALDLRMWRKKPETSLFSSTI